MGKNSKGVNRCGRNSNSVRKMDFSITKRGIRIGDSILALVASSFYPKGPRSKPLVSSLNFAIIYAYFDISLETVGPIGAKVWLLVHQGAPRSTPQDLPGKTFGPDPTVICEIRVLDSNLMHFTYPTMLNKLKVR
ncbi:hypothetical protein NPIL_193781 [Nephila pilipes]|uniref:Uncharacterized protein n=1 Tax=Nephila pilipes TaxID=299642 RepID=A0A8X6QDK0_NEPPI|nr:hypothetical protein NPIL_193781 [Nephila pilipes]